MGDWFKKLFSEPQTLGVIVTSGVVGLFIGATTGIIQRRHGDWPSFFASVATAAGVAVICGLAINDLVPSETLRFAIIGVCAVVSEDILGGLRALGRGLRADPIGFVVRVLDALRGVAPSARAAQALQTGLPIAQVEPPPASPGEGGANPTGEGQ